MTSPGEPRGNGPASSADGADAGSVVFVGIDPSTWPVRPTDPERLNAVVHGIAAMREGVVRVGEAVRQVAEAFDLPPEFVTGPSVDLDANEELIRSTRAEFPDDPYEYGRRYPHGPMRWTPPAEGEETPSCPA